jgi:4,5-dihydroxyphthalate decarboxylase
VANYKLKLACSSYPWTNAILDGQVKLDGVDLEIVKLKDIRSGFADMHYGKFDAGEFSTTELIYYHSRGQKDLVGIPIFPWRSFRHSFIFCNVASGVDGPKSLIGKKIGCSWIQTAAIWVRGTLAEEYGLAAKDVNWHIYGVHHWDEEGDREHVQPRDGSVIRWEETKGQNGYALVDQHLVEGKINAAIFPRPLPSILRGDQRVRRLFESFREVEADYFKKTRIFPIMHTLVLKRSLIERHPDLPKKLFDLFCESKRLGHKAMRGHWRADMQDLVWRESYFTEESALFGGDPWAYGLKKNEHVIRKLMDYCYQQGVAAVKIEPKDLFVPATLQLEDSV